MSYNYKPLYCDTDSIKVDEAIAKQEHTRALLNGIYGLQASKYWQPTIIPYCEADVNAVKEAFERQNKENKNMNREYIVIHPNEIDKVGIVFKDSIKAVIKNVGTSGTEIVIDDRSIFVSDSYEEIVKYLFK